MSLIEYKKRLEIKKDELGLLSNKERVQNIMEKKLPADFGVYTNCNNDSTNDPPLTNEEILIIESLKPCNKCCHEQYSTGQNGDTTCVYCDSRHKCFSPKIRRT